VRTDFSLRLPSPEIAITVIDLVPAGTPLLNGSPGGLNNRGEIGTNAFSANGTWVSFLLTPIHNAH
jgi:hypothetical protein